MLKCSHLFLTAMLPILVRLLVITLLYQCAQGKKVVRRLNTNSESRDEWLHKDDDSRYFYEESSNRIRRNTGSSPVAHSFTLEGDRHQFARVRYAGEGSDVRLLMYT